VIIVVRVPPNHRPDVRKVHRPDVDISKRAVFPDAGRAGVSKQTLNQF
jgi:hypothetical protein